jgi:predicted amidohydrolase
MRIAVAQTPGTRLDQWQDTRTLLEDLIARAAGLKAALVVLPECVWPAYCLGTKQAYLDARAAGLPGPADFLTRVCRTARQWRIAICAGYVAEAGDRLFNAAALIGADGRVAGTCHKRFLWAFDRDYFDPGDRIEPVESAFGRVGLMVCADARLPEIPATLAARGAELILHPTAWVNAGSADTPWNPQPEFLIPTRAAECGVPVASASKWGAEGDTTFVGSSLICDSDGHVLAQCCRAETTVIVADVEPRPPRCPQMTDSERSTLLSPTAPTLPRADVGPLELRLIPPGDSGTGPALALARARGSVLSAAEAQSFAPARCLALQGAHLVVVYDGWPAAAAKARACENRIFVVTTDPGGWGVIDPRGLVIHEGRWPVGSGQVSEVTLEISRAASKTVAPHTDVIRGRRPEQYCFTGT